MPNPDYYPDMKSDVRRAILLLAATALLIGCASTDDLGSTSQTSTPVPGEKTSEEGMTGTAGPGVAGAGVHW
ncbi:MAG: hypothetical protein QOH39_2037 [Verrucomicrobiota bacterium]|jgi:hypothetical protein